MMHWEFIIATGAIPVVLFPAMFVWYLNAGSIYSAVKEARGKRATCKKGFKEIAQVWQINRS